MHGDFSRNTFRRERGHSRVLLQQGRVLLDADWNEQQAIVLHHLRTLAADLIGPHGGPGNGFEVQCDEQRRFDFAIGWGHYYVDGILCENQPPRRSYDQGDRALTYTTQPDYPLQDDDPAVLQAGTSYLVYLDVWERHLTHLHVEDLREVALGGADTATRARVVCQVKAVEDGNWTDEAELTCDDLLHELLPHGDGYLRARARVDTRSEDPCIIPPQSRYRGPENQLYRVEIHRGGERRSSTGGATYKWSRDNGSVIFGIRSLQGSIATLGMLGADARHSLKEGDWVEVVDDHSELRSRPRPLLRVDAVDRVNYEVQLDVPSGVDVPVFDENSTTHPLLRRWDQDADAIAVQEGTWIDLEDGVQILFEPDGRYQTGDYWLIPARTATGDVLWPTERTAHGGRQPEALPPDGVEHHYAPLAHIAVDGNGVVTCEDTCRCTFEQLCSPSSAQNAFRYDAVLFDRNSDELDERAMARLSRNIESMKERSGREAKLWLELRGFASRDEDDPENLARRRALRAERFYRENGAPTDRIDVSVDISAPQYPPHEQRRVETVAMLRRSPRVERRYPVIEIDGVGPAFERRLVDEGITDAAQVAGMEASELASILSRSQGRPVPETVAEAIIEAAKTLLRR